MIGEGLRVLRELELVVSVLKVEKEGVEMWEGGFDVDTK